MRKLKKTKKTSHKSQRTLENKTITTTSWFKYINDNSFREIASIFDYNKPYFTFVVNMKPKRSETTVEIRELVIKLKKDGKSLSKIGEIIGKSKSTVQTILKNCKKTNTVTNKPRSGRPSKLTERDKRFILREVSNNPMISAVDLAADIPSTSATNVHAECVRRVLRAAGYNSRIPRKKPFISSKNMDKRLKYALEHKDKSIDFWENVLFTDESKFNIFGYDGKQKVWRKKCQEMETKNLIPTVKHGGGSVMVWGSMASSGVGNLQFIDTKMDRFLYLNILKKNLKQSADKLHLKTNWTFQQDNDPKHTAHIVKDWLAKHIQNQLNHPPQSPDLNPIENLWDDIDRRVRKHKISKKDDLKRILIEEWEKTSTSLTKTLVESMPRRLQAVIDFKGGPTKY